jgi:hypothetical protein
LHNRVLGLSIAFVAFVLATLGLGGVASTAGADTFLRENFLTETSGGNMFGPLLSEVAAGCSGQCHWTITQGADVEESEFPVRFNPEADVHTDEALSPWANPRYEGTETPDNFWHIQRNAQSVEILPYVRENLIELALGESPNLPAAPAEDSEPAEYVNQNLRGWLPRYPWFGEGNEEGGAHEPVTATGTYCGLKAGIEMNGLLAKNGCRSQGTPEGELVSPPFSLETASAAFLRFKTWWEIETQSPGSKDLLAVDYSTDTGKEWTPAALLNPGARPVAESNYLPYSNVGLQRAPEWTEDVVDLQAALPAHSKEVEVRFRFDARDELHNGYRGWGVDNISVGSEAPPAPTITGCSIGASGTPVIEGTGFLLGSKVKEDEYEPETTLAQSSNRIELPLNFYTGRQRLQVIGPEGGTGNSEKVTVNVTPPTCALVKEEATTTTSTTSTTSTTGAGSAYPTRPASERGHPAVDLRNGEIEGEFQFPEPGTAEWTGVVSKGASLSRVPGAGMATLADPLSALERRGAASSPAVASAKPCRKGYVRKNGRCVSNAPVAYGRTTLTVRAAGRYKLIIKPTSRVRSALKRGKTLNVRLTLTFIPAHTTRRLLTTASVNVHEKKR